MLRFKKYAIHISFEISIAILSMVNNFAFENFPKNKYIPYTLHIFLFFSANKNSSFYRKRKEPTIHSFILLSNWFQSLVDQSMIYSIIVSRSRTIFLIERFHPSLFLFAPTIFRINLRILINPARYSDYQLGSSFFHSPVETIRS